MNPITNKADTNTRGTRTAILVGSSTSTLVPPLLSQSKNGGCRSPDVQTNEAMVTQKKRPDQASQAAGRDKNVHIFQINGEVIVSVSCNSTLETQHRVRYDKKSGLRTSSHTSPLCGVFKLLNRIVYAPPKPREMRAETSAIRAAVRVIT